MISKQFQNKLIFIANDQNRSITTGQISEAKNQNIEDKKEFESPTNVKGDYDIIKHWIQTSKAKQMKKKNDQNQTRHRV